MSININLKNDEDINFWEIGVSGELDVSTADEFKEYLHKLIDEEIRNMGFDITDVNIDFDVNESVRIMNGPLENFIGVVQEINKEKRKVKVMVSMFGRETPVELDFIQVQKVK